jgi:hypothetical protein
MKTKKLLLFFVVIIVVIISCKKKENYTPQIPSIRNGRLCVNVVYKMLNYSEFDVLLYKNATSSVVVVFGSNIDNIKDTVAQINKKNPINIISNNIFVKFMSSDYYTNTRGSIVEISNLK